MNERDLTATSYALLSLLAVRPWSAYELAQQMGRSLRWYWPKAESLVYKEPKKLVRLGLATTRLERQGLRSRTVYTISEKGRKALRLWFDQPTAGPRMEFEAMLQVAFADLGTHEQLLATLRAIRADADRNREIAHAQMRDYAQTGGPFPERLAIIALTGKFFVEFTDLLARWAAWAEHAVAQWDGVDEESATVPQGAFQPGHWPGSRLHPTSRGTSLHTTP
jgi:DNA-binding PadR family transcriptional regulator